MREFQRQLRHFVRMAPGRPQCALGLAGFFFVAGAGAARPKQPMVRAIHVQPAPGRKASTFLPYITQKSGQPLSQRAVQRSIQNLFATGVFASVEVREKKAPGGVALYFRTRPNYFITLVRVKNGPNPPSDTELADISGLQIGELYTRARLKQAAGRILDRMANYQYRQAKVQPEIARHPGQAGVQITLILQAGPLARLGQLSFTGYGLVAPKLLRKAVKLRPGERLTQKRLLQARAGLRKLFARLGRLTAQLRLLTSYNAPANRLDLKYEIKPGPLVTVAVEGNVISHSVLRREVPIFQEHAADEELMNEGRRNLRDYLQGKGYYEARVEFRRIHPKPGWLEVLYTVHTGPKEELRAILFRGNHYFSKDQLEPQLAERPTAPLLPNFIPGVRGRFSHRLMEGDARAITSLYHANGFAQARVTPVILRRYHGQPGHLAVRFDIQEGRQTVVRRLTITGNRRFSVARIESWLNTAPGEPYSPYTVAADRNRILERYYNHGYLQAQCRSQIHAVAGRPFEDVAFTIYEGPVDSVHQVYISGERFVKPAVIARQIQVKPGQPLSQTKLLATQRRLYDMDLFTGVSVAVQNPSSDLPAKDVLVVVHEAPRYSFSEGVGMQFQGGTGVNQIPSISGSGFSPDVSFQLTRLAVTGRPQTLSLDTLYGSIERRAGLDYRLPYFLTHRKWKLDLSALYDDRYDLVTFRAIREQTAAQLSTQPASDLQVLYRLVYRRVQAIISPGSFSAQQVPLLSRPAELAIAETSLVRDRRDNPTDTHAGTYDTASVAIAKSYGASNFVRLMGEHAFYIPLDTRRHWILANATRVGEELPFGAREPSTLAIPGQKPVTTQVYDIPLPERFFSGGADSLRGFAFDQAGPRDPVTGVPVGGTALFINNLELRFPLIGRDIGGVWFYDAGNVYSSFRSLLRGLGRYHPPSLTDLNYTSDTLGFGLRYKTPVGPVRLDFGYLLNPPAFQTYNKTKLVQQQLSHFQFFFSIGQTF